MATNGSAAAPGGQYDHNRVAQFIGESPTDGLLTSRLSVRGVPAAAGPSSSILQRRRADIAFPACTSGPHFAYASGNLTFLAPPPLNLHQAPNPSTSPRPAASATLSRTRAVTLPSPRYGRACQAHGSNGATAELQLTFPGSDCQQWYRCRQGDPIRPQVVLRDLWRRAHDRVHGHGHARGPRDQRRVHPNG